ncbi:hypothetical protein [Plasmodium yoelii yoelii]|uniref:Uncharacterized protein n=1 Tax=Plasmodium yoelii yoelii TaxID=73239 RepID=Q7RHJ0_PLAYO|nr:hypothetical protein [Plasmodium yoelii yoelii]
MYRSCDPQEWKFYFIYKHTQSFFPKISTQISPLKTKRSKARQGKA